MTQQTIQKRIVHWVARASVLLPVVALAQNGALGVGYVNGYAAPARCLPCTILLIINYVLAIVGVVALAYLVYGGFLYITSGGNDDKVEQGKSIIINAIIGIVVIGVAAALINYVVGAVLQRR